MGCTDSMNSTDSMGATDLMGSTDSKGSTDSMSAADSAGSAAPSKGYTVKEVPARSTSMNAGSSPALISKGITLDVMRALSSALRSVRSNSFFSQSSIFLSYLPIFS